MRRIVFIYILILASQLIVMGILATQQEYILSDPTLYRISWTKTWGGQFKDYPYDTIFTHNALYVTGDTYSRGPGPANLFLQKYSQEGELDWTKYHWEDGYTMGRGIASDGDHIYVSGIHFTENTSYSILLKYDPDGNLIWEREWNPGSDAKSSGVAVDNSGDIYVTGYVTILKQQRQFLLKYDDEGTLLYQIVIESDASETAWGISVSDAVYICGEVTHNVTLKEETGLSTAKLLLTKINKDGKMLWRREASIGLDNVANAVNSEQDIIVAGYTGYQNGTAKSVLLRFNEEGEQKSTVIIGESVIEDMAWGVTRAGRYVYVAGHARPQFTDLGDFSLHKIGPNDEILWENYYRDYSLDMAESVTVDGDDVYVVGRTYWRDLDMQVLVRKYVSPNDALTPMESSALKLSPILTGALLLVLIIYEAIRNTLTCEHRTLQLK